MKVKNRFKVIVKYNNEEIGIAQGVTLEDTFDRLLMLFDKSSNWWLK